MHHLYSLFNAPKFTNILSIFIFFAGIYSNYVVKSNFQPNNNKQRQKSRRFQQ